MPRQNDLCIQGFERGQGVNVVRHTPVRRIDRDRSISREHIAAEQRTGALLEEAQMSAGMARSVHNANPHGRTAAEVQPLAAV